VVADANTIFYVFADVHIDMSCEKQTNFFIAVFVLFSNNSATKF